MMDQLEFTAKVKYLRSLVSQMDDAAFFIKGATACHGEKVIEKEYTKGFFKTLKENGLAVSKLTEELQECKPNFSHKSNKDV